MIFLFAFFKKNNKRFSYFCLFKRQREKGKRKRSFPSLVHSLGAYNSWRWTCSKAGAQSYIGAGTRGLEPLSTPSKDALAGSWGEVEMPGLQQTL